MRMMFPILLTALALLVSPPAQAYLDPSTGSMIISAIVGLLASIALAVKTYWYKLKAMFRRGGDETATPPGEAGD